MHPNGKIKEEGTFIRNSYRDSLKRFHENGVIEFEAKYNHLPMFTYFVHSSVFFSNVMTAADSNFSKKELKLNTNNKTSQSVNNKKCMIGKSLFATFQ